MSTVDLANPPTPHPGSTIFGGSLIIRGHDYATETGVDLLKKLITRRLVTPKGAFAHLPDYGLGLVQAKQLFKSNDLVKLKAEIERQCRLEPDVARATAGITLDRSGTLLVTVAVVRASDGQQLQVSVGG